MMVHRVGQTLLLDDFDIHKHLLRQQQNDWAWLRKFYENVILRNIQQGMKVNTVVYIYTQHVECCIGEELVTVIYFCQAPRVLCRGNTGIEFKDFILGFRQSTFLCTTLKCIEKFRIPFIKSGIPASNLGSSEARNPTKFAACNDQSVGVPQLEEIVGSLEVEICDVLHTSKI